MHTSRVLLAAAVASAVIGHTAARAAVIPGLFNTGVDDNGVALLGGNGVADPHYVIATSTLPTYVGLSAVTYRHQHYAIDDLDSRWVSLTETGGPGSHMTTYRLSFSLAGLDPATARISGAYGADNLVTIFLNGVNTGWTTSAFHQLGSFSLTSGFVGGMNTLDFLVTDGAAPGALRVDDLAGTADLLAPPPTGSVPEPATWALMLTGFFGMGGVLRSRRRAALA